MRYTYDNTLGNWRNEPVIVIMASGPSMCQADADAVRNNSNAPVIVVNDTWRLAPWADVLYTNDHDWLQTYREEVLEKFEGRIVCGHHFFKDDERIGHIPFKDIAGLQCEHNGKYIAWGMNSGGAALALAYHMLGGASGSAFREAEGRPDPSILLLGYDQQWKTMPDGSELPRWHGRHPEHLQNQKPGFHRWASWFACAARDFKEEHISVYNCSRETALQAFERRELDSFFPSEGRKT